MASRGKAVVFRFGTGGMARRGEVQQGGRGWFGCVGVRSGRARRSRYVRARKGLARSGEVWRSRRVWRSLVRFGEVWFGGRGMLS